MSHELRHALDDLVQGVATEHQAGAGLPVDAMTARARRARVRFTTLVSTAAACAVVAVGAGGVAVATWDRADPVPAAPPTRESTPTPSPDVTAPPATPSATADVPAVVLPSADRALAFGACGSTTDPGAAVPSSPAVALTLAAAPAVALRGEPLELRSELAVTGPGLAAFGPDSGPTVLLLRDGVVVATAPTYPASAAVETVTFLYDAPDHRSASAFVSHAAPVVCDAPGASAGAPLPAGRYQAIAVSDAWTADHDAASAVMSDGVRTIADLAPSVPLQHVVAVSAPVEVQVGDDLVDPAAVATPPQSAPVPGDRNVPDGDPYPSACSSTLTPGDAGGLLPVTGPTGTVLAGTAAAVSVTYTGSGRAALSVEAQFLKVVQDGVVVAVSASTPLRVDVDRGSTVDTPVTTWQSCTDGWPGATTTLESGTYTAYPVALVGVLGLVAADGTVVQERGSEVDLHQLVGAPVTLVVP
jgi:hypothetical protein